MKKILVTDFLGTLIPEEYTLLSYLYGDASISNNLEQQQQNIEKALKVLSFSLNDFLRNGNEINIVTSIDAHMTPSYLLEVLKSLCRKLEYHQKQMYIFFQTQNLEKTIKGLNGCVSISNANGRVTATTPDNIEMTFLEEKKEVYKYIRYLGSLLYAVGDTPKDLEMLCGSLDKGGQAAFINYNLYQREEQLKSILSATLSREESFMLEEEAIKRYSNYFSLNKDERDSIKEHLRSELITNELEYTRRIELYEKALRGEVDLNRLYLEDCSYQVISNYNSTSDYWFMRHGIIPESTCHSISMYPTFTDYYNRILKK